MKTATINFFNVGNDKLIHSVTVSQGRKDSLASPTFVALNSALSFIGMNNEIDVTNIQQIPMELIESVTAIKGKNAVPRINIIDDTYFMQVDIEVIVK